MTGVQTCALPILIAYELGHLSSIEFAVRTIGLIEFQSSTAEFMEAWADIFTPNNPMIQRAQQWNRQGIPLYALSNTNEAHINFFTKRDDVFDVFQGMVYSCREGVAKPNHAIYQRLLDRYSLKPETTLFIDDLSQNVAVARELGFQTIQYQNETILGLKRERDALFEIMPCGHARRYMHMGDCTMCLDEIEAS